MKNSSPFVSYVEPGAPATVRVIGCQDSEKSSYQIYLDERQNDIQISFLYSKGMTSPEPIPDEFRSYALLLDRPLLLLKVLAPEAMNTWLLIDWCSDQQLATKIVLAHSADPELSLRAAQLRRSAEDAIAIHRTFCRAS